MEKLFLYLLTAYVLTPPTYSQTPRQYCNSWNDLQVTCFSVPNYIGNQWATCLSNSTIYSLSDGKRKCPPGHAYCHYQCMSERYSISSVLVYQDCACKTEGEVVKNVLPSWCYNPPLTSCNWYKKCLDLKYSCGGDTYPYTLSIGDYFCEINLKYKDRLSPKGYQWSNAVKKCLQRSLVSEIRAYVRPTYCKGLKATAYNRHKACFSKPHKRDAPSVCDIEVKDISQTICTIKATLLPSSFDLSLRGFVNSIYACPNGPKELLGIRRIHLSARFLRLQRRYERSTAPKSKTQLQIEYNLLAARYFDSLAQTINIRKNDSDWFVFATRVQDTSAVIYMTVGVYFMDRTVCDMSYSGPKYSYLERHVSQIGNYVQKGRRVKVDRFVVAVQKMQACRDIYCRNHYDVYLSSSVKFAIQHAILVFPMIGVLLMR